MPPILNKWACLRQVGRRFERSLGKEALARRLVKVEVPGRLSAGPYGLGNLIFYGLLASGLRSPQLPVGLGALSPAGLWAPELPRLPASARSPCSTAKAHSV